MHDLQPLAKFHTHRHADRFLLNASWLVKLRWVAVAGQMTTIFFSTIVLQIEINLPPLLVVLALTSVSNIALFAWFLKKSDSFSQEDEVQNGNLVLALIVALDLLSLTTMLFFSGGPTNPFCFFFFVNLSLAAVLLTLPWSWATNLLSIACFSFLLYDYEAINLGEFEIALPSIRSSGKTSIVHVGMLTAFSTCSSVIVYFMARLNSEIHEQEINLRLAESLQARGEKLEALGTLAAGAAHELATPLSTIAVVAKEVENEVKKIEADKRVVEDIVLIRSELDRCRTILDRMAPRAGQAIGESFNQTTVKELVDEIAAGLPDSCQPETRYKNESAEIEFQVPRVGLAQALRGLVQNAIDVTPEDQHVTLLVDRDETEVNFVIQDRGQGMSPEVLNRISEPFFTTKETGQGMGLGVFLAHTVIQRLDGRMEFRSRLGQGTTVIVHLPLASSDLGNKMG